MLSINYDKCLSVKNKKTHIQCTYNKKNGCLFCGIHSKSKNITRVDNLPDFYINIKKDLLNKKTENQIKTDKKIKIIDDNSTYSKDFIMNSTINLIKVGKLRKTIKKLNLLKFINKNRSKRILYNDLVIYLNREKEFLQNINKIIKIQSFFRRYIILKRSNCTNDSDCVLMMNIYEIPSIYFYKYYEEKSNKYFGFDIRTLVQIINEKEPKNPFTLQELNTTVVKEEIIKRVNKGIDLNFAPEKFSIEKETELRAINVFHEFDLLGNYTNHRWFFNLNLYDLKDYYKKLEDMFNYRINLTKEQLKTYVEDGIAFKKNISLLYKIKDINKLRNIILEEFEEILKYDNNISDKKTAIMWILISLTEVSLDARNAMPHLDQGML